MAQKADETEGERRYREHLAFGKTTEEKIRAARKVLPVEEQKRTANRQTTATFLVCRQNGFYNTVVETFIGEIPVGEKAGMHRHMNEAAIYILQGRGHSIIEDQRVDWKKGDALHIPFFAWHQHFNDGDETVKFLAAIPTELMRSMGIWRLEQKEEKGRV
jgi:quercetin dioxygenase-like cupin family protein